MVLFIKRSSILFVIMILVVSYLILNLRVSRPVSGVITPLVILDAGHGAPDGGSTGVKTGVLEKDLNLEITMKIKERLGNEPVNIIMTREDDRGIYPKEDDTIRDKKRKDLQERVRIANESGAAALVSIHMNYFTAQKYSGPQIFYSVNHPSGAVLAKDIMDKIVEIIGPHCTRETKPIKNEILLLREAEVPAVIVECGFLSNAAEERLLMDGEYQGKMADAVSQGIMEFLKR